MSRICLVNTLAATTVLLAVGLTGATAAVAGADPAPARTTSVPVTAYEMPFPCGQTWTGTTRANHSPSPQSVDWNRTDDLGDPVIAAAAGTVEVAESIRGSYGTWVMIDHGNDESTIYAHLSSLAVSKGQHVAQGALIGTVGESGNANGAHLHFEERVGRSDVAVWFHGSAFTYNSTVTSQNCVDVPIAADFVDGPGADPVVFRRRTKSSFQVAQASRTKPRIIVFGAPTDQPLVGDWDGDGVADVGVRNPTTRVFSLRTASGATSTVTFGGAGDLAIAGDWDADGRTDVGVRRAGSGIFRLRLADGSVAAIALGEADDLPVTGDWDGDGATDLGVFDPATATFTLRVVADGTAYLTQVQYGSPGELPVTGDWDDNGRTDLGVFDPATGVFDERRAETPAAEQASTVSVQFAHPRP